MKWNGETSREILFAGKKPDKLPLPAFAALRIIRISLDLGGGGDETKNFDLLGQIGDNN